jgi:hypothetical protein
VALPAKEVVPEGNDTNLAAPAPPAKESVPSLVASEKTAPTESPAEPATAAKTAKSVEVQGNQAILNTDGRIERHEQFTLRAPPRLVVDIYGVQPSFTKRLFRPRKDSAV